MLLAPPLVAAWMWRDSESAKNLSAADTPVQATVQIPVEIVATGSTSQIVYVEVPSKPPVCCSSPPENESRALFALGVRPFAP